MFKCTGRYLGKKKYISLEEEQHEAFAKAKAVDVDTFDADAPTSLSPPWVSVNRGGGGNDVEIL